MCFGLLCSLELNHTVEYAIRMLVKAVLFVCLLGAQDGNPPGEGVIISDIDRDGWVRVRWDNGATNSYRMGKDGKYDLRLAPSEVPKKTAQEELEDVEDIRLSEWDRRGEDRLKQSDSFLCLPICRQAGSSAADGAGGSGCPGNAAPGSPAGTVHQPQRSQPPGEADGTGIRAAEKVRDLWNRQR